MEQGFSAPTCSFRAHFSFRCWKNNARFVSLPVCTCLLLILLVLPLRAEEADEQEVEEEEAPRKTSMPAFSRPQPIRCCATVGSGIGLDVQAGIIPPTRGLGRPPKLLSANSLSTTENSLDRLTPVSSPVNAAELAAC